MTVQPAEPRSLGHGRRPFGFGPAVPMLAIGALPVVLAVGLNWLPGQAVELLHEQVARRADSMAEAAVQSTRRAVVEGLQVQQASPWLARIDGWNCVVRKIEGPKGADCSDWLVTEVENLGAQQRGQFRFPWLPGAAPEALALPFLHLQALKTGAPTAPWPELDAEAVRQGEAFSAALSWLRDAGPLANEHVQGGTDLRDWQFADPRESRVDLSKILGDARHGAVLVVDGNLWIDGGGEPLVVATDHAVTVLVRGNVWMLDSLLVSGSGHLTIAVQRGALRAGQVAGSIAPVEGLAGLIVQTSARADAVPRCDANLVVEGRMTVAGGGICCSGALLVRGALDVEAGVPFSVSGDRVLDPACDAVPGFVVSGPPRPGRMVQVPCEAGPAVP